METSFPAGSAITTEWFFEPLTPYAYDLIVIDPPLRFKAYSGKGEKKSPQAQYPTMTDAEVLDLPVGVLASRHAMLLLWSGAPKLPLALKMVERWGFSYKSVMMWRKLTVNGKARLGPGFRVRSTGEVVIVATVGKPKQDYAPPTIFDGLARQHSRKPEEFYAIAERMMLHARRADVFARQTRPGWESFGNELQRFGAVP